MLMELNDTHPRNHECISRHPAGRTLSWWDVWPMLGSQAEIAMEPNGQTRGVPATLDNPMSKPDSTMAEQIAMAVSEFQQRTTGHVPMAVTVVLCGDTLVITLHNALSPAEKALSKSLAGAAQVQEFHKQLFAISSDSLCQDIKRITGVEVRGSTVEVEPSAGTVVDAFASGNMVQVFHLVHGIPVDTWNKSGPADQPEQAGSRQREPKEAGAK